MPDKRARRLHVCGTLTSSGNLGLLDWLRTQKCAHRGRETLTSCLAATGQELHLNPEPNPSQHFNTDGAAPTACGLHPAVKGQSERPPQGKGTSP